MSVLTRSLLLALVLLAQQGLARASSDIYGYIDANGVAHFAAEKVDERYQVFFRGGQSFDTAEGLRPLRRGGGAKTDGKVPAAAQTLLALFESSPSYKAAKAALRTASSKHAIDYELLQALIAAESGFNAQAVSPKGARGLMQLMPATAQRYGVAADKRGTIEAKLFDPRVNIAAGSRYLSDLIEMFPGQIELALAAYNAGEGAVQRAGNKIPNYKETQNYVRTVLQLYAYLKPDAGLGRTARRGHIGGSGGKVPGRVRMELAAPRGGAIGRGNMPADTSGGRPSLPTLPEFPDLPALPAVPDSGGDAPVS